MGNPPFLGFTYMSPEQKADMLSLFPKNKNLDFVCGWYKKASDLIQGTATRCAFVSTNSITQGEQVAVLWKNINVEIDFAYRTFKWHNEAKGNAAVHCVIIGFSAFGNGQKWIFDDDKAIPARNINGYLMDAPDVAVESISKPLCDVPVIVAGGKPAEGGNLIFTEEEKYCLLALEPQAGIFIRPFMMGSDFIQRRPRFCLWLRGVDPKLLRSCPHVLARVSKVQEFRLLSKKPATRAKAATPTLFDEVREPTTAYIAIPKVSSQTRKYIPIDYLDQGIVPGDKLFFLEHATLYHFGVLNSSMHMAWMRAVAGRLKSDYSYSNTIVYNNFIWPDLCALCDSASLRLKIEQAAQAVLDARAAHPGATLADLYDPLTMPPDLVKAHAHLDSLVDKAYGLKPTATDSDRVALLFKLYAEKTKGSPRQ